MVVFANLLFAGRIYQRGQAFLEWKMSPSDYFAETTRIKELEGQFGEKVLKSNDLFDYPSFIAEYDLYSWFEYAIVDETTFTIRYIRLFDIESIENLLFPVQWGPAKLLKDSDIAKDIDLSGSYSIYWGP